MGLMQQHIDGLTSLTREADGDSAYYGHVRQIKFNAWHYADANLWASPVTRVFEGLADSGEDRATIIGLLETTARQREAAHHELLLLEQRGCERFGRQEGSVAARVLAVRSHMSLMTCQ
jgi:hypothetical protein